MIGRNNAYNSGTLNHKTSRLARTISRNDILSRIIIIIALLLSPLLRYPAEYKSAKQKPSITGDFCLEYGAHPLKPELLVDEKNVDFSSHKGRFSFKDEEL